MAKEGAATDYLCWNCLVKNHVKKNASVVIKLDSKQVKSLFVNLQKEKENKKKETSTTSQVPQ